MKHKIHMQNDDKYGFSSESNARNEAKPNTEENRKKNIDMAIYVLMYVIEFIHKIKRLVYSLEEMQRNKEAEQKAVFEQETAKKLAELIWSDINQHIKQFIDNSKKKLEELQAVVKEKELAEICLIRLSEKIRQLDFEIEQIKAKIDIVTELKNRKTHQMIARVNEILDTFPKELAPLLKDYFNNVVAPRYLKDGGDRQTKEMLPEMIDEIYKHYESLLAKEKPASSEKAAELQKRRIESQKASVQTHINRIRNDKVLNECSREYNALINSEVTLTKALVDKTKERDEVKQQFKHVGSSIKIGEYKEINNDLANKSFNVQDLYIPKEFTDHLQNSMKEGERALKTILNITEEGRVPDEKMLNVGTIEINNSAAHLAKEISAIEIEKAPELSNSEPKTEDVQQVSDELDKLFKDVEAGLNIASESPLKDPSVVPEPESPVAVSTEKSTISSGFFASDPSKSLNEVEGAPSDKEKEHESVSNEEIEGEEPRRSFQHR